MITLSVAGLDSFSFNMESEEFEELTEENTTKMDQKSHVKKLKEDTKTKTSFKTVTEFHSDDETDGNVSDENGG